MTTVHILEPFTTADTLLFVSKRMCETAEVLASEPERQSSPNGSIANVITGKLNDSTFNLAAASSKRQLSQPKLISQQE